MSVLTLAQLKATTNIGSPAQDAELQLYVNAVPDVLEGLLGGPVEQRTVTETVEVTDGGRALLLGQRFAVSVTSITANGTAVSTSDVVVAAGNVLRRKVGYPFSLTTDPVVAVYVAGIAAVGAVPSAITLAGAFIAAHMWRTQRGGPAGPGTAAEDYAAAGMGFSVPNRALELLSPWLPDTGLVLC